MAAEGGARVLAGAGGLAQVTPKSARSSAETPPKAIGAGSSSSGDESGEQKFSYRREAGEKKGV